MNWFESCRSDENNFERSMLRDTAADLVSKKAGTAFTRAMAASDPGVDEALWQQMTELAWQAILVPENHDGMGMNRGDMSVVLKELGRSAHQGPFFTTAVSSVLTLNQCDNKNGKRELLQGIVNDGLIVSLALDEGYEYQWDGFSCTATRKGQNYQLSGCKLFVPYAHVADKLIVATQCGQGTGIFAVDRTLPGVTVTVLPTVSGVKLCRVEFTDVTVPEDCLLTSPASGSAVLEKTFHQCALLKCAEMIGGAEAALKMTVEHVTVRKQFGVPVGSFQAVQHRCADMLTFVDSASILLDESLEETAKDEQSLPQAAAICKVWISDAYKNTMKHAHQCMAGTGYMEETDLQLFFRHAKICELAFGSPDFYRSFLAAGLEI